MSNSNYDIAIIGGGASGLAAAISAKRQNNSLSVAIFEANQRVGKKLLTTGNGRCNLGNAGNLSGRYHGDTAFAERVLNKFTTSNTIDFFNSIGIECIELEEEKLYPMCLQANGVVDQLRFAADEIGVETLIEHRVQKIEHKGNSFIIYVNGTTYTAKKVIIATGGVAAPKSGSKGDGYTFLTNFGHSKTTTRPAIVQVITKTDLTKALAGIKVEGEISLTTKKGSRTEKGEILFTEYGLSGPPVLQISRMVAECGQGDISIDLLPDIDFTEVFSILKRRKDILKNRTTDQLLLGFLNKRVGEVVIKSAGISLSTPIAELKEKDLKDITAKIKNFKMTATGTKGFDNAQVTAGGISTKDFNADTLESKLIKGLYATGELLDVDGDCGGFNLQWAWATGYVAGISAAE
ncbi:MAG: aminoacetone oxidase family FAD-binding enzyme [Clostridia bacterium]|nr:aminoacetone oxidase family FAD-binding enzyme [Clostridia bacterium]